jgi:hypothetical protein
MGLAWQAYGLGHLAKSIHGYYLVYRNFDNEMKTNRFPAFGGCCSPICASIANIGPRPGCRGGTRTKVILYVNHEECKHEGEHAQQNRAQASAWLWSCATR